MKGQGKIIIVPGDGAEPREYSLEREMEYFVEPEEAFTRDEIE